MALGLGQTPARRRLLLALLCAGGFFLLGWGGIMVWGKAHFASPIWFATAFALCVILRLSRSRADDIAVVAALFPAGILANLLGGISWPLTIGFSLINVVGVSAGLLATRSLAVPRFSTMSRALKFFTAAAVSPSLCGAVLVFPLVTLLGGNGAWSSGQLLLSNLLGTCILFPLGMTISMRRVAKLGLRHRLLEGILVFGGTAALAVTAFGLAPYHLQFLLLAATAIAGVRFRLMGAGLSLIIITAVAAAGPARHWDLMQIEMLQFFLAVCSIVSVRAALLMNERDVHIAVIERRRRRAVRASRFKSQLLAHVSHEVRTPLSAVIGFSGMLETGALSADRAPEFASIIVHNGELLQRLHDDLLDLSRAEAGALCLVPERIKLSEAVFASVGGIRLDTALGGKNLLVDPIGEDLTVMADPLRLAQIINNLIANAYKYGDNFSPIRISAGATTDGFGRIEIVNAGPGIPPEERINIFRPYSRAQSLGRSVPGAGLGLSIAKLLVEMQGGRIDFESAPGQQTRFWVDLPLTA